MSEGPATHHAPRTTHHTMVWPLLAIVAGMLMLSYASVPLYRLFCQVTGFGGTTRSAESAPGAAAAAPIVTVRFNADTDPALPWTFAPVDRQVRVRVGDNKLAAFRATNESGVVTRGTATYNVTPHLAGKYFNKIQCFCFEEQHLNPGETVTMPVSFFIDPAILDDPDLRGISNITLSYTFFSYDSANKPRTYLP